MRGPCEKSLADLEGIPRRDVMGPYSHPPGCTRCRVGFRPGSEAHAKWPEGWVLDCFPAEAAAVLRG